MSRSRNKIIIRSSADVALIRTTSIFRISPNRPGRNCQISPIFFRVSTRVDTHHARRYDRELALINSELIDASRFPTWSNGGHTAFSRHEGTGGRPLWWRSENVMVRDAWPRVYTPPWPCRLHPVRARRRKGPPKGTRVARRESAGGGLVLARTCESSGGPPCYRAPIVLLSRPLFSAPRLSLSRPSFSSALRILLLLFFAASSPSGNAAALQRFRVANFRADSRISSRPRSRRAL